jgi:hypothetical protein
MLDFYDGRPWSSRAHVGLIYSAGYDGRRGESTWARPDVSAWILTRDKWTGRPTCEPAALTTRT